VRLRYEEHTWPELRELAAREDLVVVIPTATLEDHGHHLPIDTDARLISAICERAVASGDGRALLFPTQVHGYTPHHLDFPGSVTLRWNVFVEALVDQGRSLIHHGFDRLLFVNGHGSNQPLVDIAARLLGSSTATPCAAPAFTCRARTAAARSPRCATRRTRVGHAPVVAPARRLTKSTPASARSRNAASSSASLV
jgi:creatinine amidohydrolase/Fe(II)-dependent formamide hydrolase-like protein